MFKVLFSGFFVVVGTGCLPDYLAKYGQRPSERPEVSVNSKSPSTHPAVPKRDVIFAVDKRTFRFKLDFNSVWNSALEVLLHNYNLNIASKDSGVITTEWDTFFLKDAVFRNKISVRVKKSSWKTVDVIVYNNVETLNHNATQIGPVWYPAANDSKEVKRLIQNMAVVLNQDPPKMFSKLTKDEMSSQSGKKIH